MAGGNESPCDSGDGETSLPIRFEIPSDFDAGRDVQKTIMDRVEGCGFDPQSAFAIKLSLEEALINAIKHGNKLDPDKKVWVEAQVSPQSCRIVIEDEGPGFERTDVPDPLEDENLTKASGRGILLIEAYMNSVAWDHGGRRVVMVKSNDAASEDDAGG